ncbi:MAG: DNA-directed RNA polymerase subunit alpha [Planctomycetota bacterium]|jgi:DNA-directed RNA polymerase subunit alpha
MMRIRWKGFELPVRVVPEAEGQNERYTKFIAEPFERGYGHTIGNSLRRVLLSSLEGAAPVSLKIDGASHEFTALKGVYEDVTDVVLNIKQMRVKMHTADPVTLRLEKKGKGEVLAGDFTPDERVEILNPDLVLCTLTEAVDFKAEVVVKRGRGFVPAEEQQLEPIIGLIPLDSVFSPVRRVRYTVEATRVGRLTNYDRLVLEIWTDGTVAPDTALAEGASLLRKHLNPFVKYFEIGTEAAKELVAPEEVEAPKADKARDELLKKLELPISVLDPSSRAENVMQANRIATLRDLVARPEEEMAQLKGFGKTSLREIKKKLADLGLTFGMPIPGQEEPAAVPGAEGMPGGEGMTPPPPPPLMP